MENGASAASTAAAAGAAMEERFAGLCKVRFQSLSGLGISVLRGLNPFQAPRPRPPLVVCMR
jgi:hypothetical protein